MGSGSYPFIGEKSCATFKIRFLICYALVMKKSSHPWPFTSRRFFSADNSLARITCCRLLATVNGYLRQIEVNKSQHLARTTLYIYILYILQGCWLNNPVTALLGTGQKLERRELVLVLFTMCNFSTPSPNLLQEKPLPPLM